MADVAFALVLNLHQPSGNLDDLLDEQREWEVRVRPATRTSTRRGAKRATSAAVSREGSRAAVPGQPQALLPERGGAVGYA